MKLGYLITHYGQTVASVSAWKAEDGVYVAMLECSNAEESTHVQLDTAELRATAASLLDLADEIDGLNEASP